ncbi:hypothetical protein OOK29_25990 [Streptomyces phaeochromogenes]|uniref:hypothetical protein n=1 Tax=Streptomyces phaeochromogenes TaxID=1923 RepID=UPI00225B089C|nr:hypothetical protein [Streptomyces phaeochromogenes]MCX5601606.1 hypothetical protein [Streptomyces phaeochromogenes]
MANVVFNQAKGMVGYYAGLPAANDAIIAVPIETAGIVSDATMIDYDTLADLLAGASNEQTTMGRKTLGSVTSTVDDTNDRRNMDAGDITWTAAGGNPISAVVLCYVPDNTAPNDATTIPLTKHDAVMTPDGNDFLLTIADWSRAS